MLCVISGGCRLVPAGVGCRGLDGPAPPQPAAPRGHPDPSAAGRSGRVRRQQRGAQRAQLLPYGEDVASLCLHESTQTARVSVWTTVTSQTRLCCNVFCRFVCFGVVVFVAGGETMSRIISSGLGGLTHKLCFHYSFSHTKKYKCVGLMSRMVVLFFTVITF